MRSLSETLLTVGSVIIAVIALMALLVLWRKVGAAQTSVQEAVSNGYVTKVNEEEGWVNTDRNQVTYTRSEVASQIVDYLEEYPNLTIRVDTRTVRAGSKYSSLVKDNALFTTETNAVYVRDIIWATSPDGFFTPVRIDYTKSRK